MAARIDLVLINPGNRSQVYQALGRDFSGIEPPFWIAALAAYLRQKGIGVSVIDANAEEYTPQETAAKVNNLKPLLSAVMVYGAQPSASTQNMTVAGEICKLLKSETQAKVAIGGLHPTALPERTLKEEHVHFVIEGEGALTLAGLITSLRAGKQDYSQVPGLWHYDDSGNVSHNRPAPLIGNLDELLPIAAWDLLPMQKYRAHNWHCFDDISSRAPYAAIYTSLGCPYSCAFCCINALFGKPGIRYRSPQLVIEEIELLHKRYGVKNFKIIDELFIFKESHYGVIVSELIKKGLGLNIWAYARVDTVNTGNLEMLKKAGFNWLALGIESADPNVRDGASKRIKVKDIKDIVRSIHDAGIRIIGNFIFGLPDDDLRTMRETLDLAKDLRCEYVNFYCAMAYPGSRLYEIALKEHWALPECWHGYSQHAYETLPLPTKYVSAREVLQFRDNAFYEYFEDPAYLMYMETTFGPEAKQHIQEMTKITIKRKLLGD